MAQQDKTDFYWNGMLAGAINNLYYDLINVDVCHVPYATNHRNSSFFLKTRLGYLIDESWYNWNDTDWYEVTDVKIIWEEECSTERWTVYALWKKWKKKSIFAAPISNWCVWKFYNCSELCKEDEWYDVCPDMTNEPECSDWKLFTTEFVKGNSWRWSSLIEPIWGATIDEPGVHTWIQMNRYNLWTTLWYFSDEYVENRDAKFKWKITSVWSYILVYDSLNRSEDWFAWQVRMITGTEDFWGVTRITVDAPWSWFSVVDTSSFAQWQEKFQTGGGLTYAVFDDWGEVVWFTSNNKIYLLPLLGDCKAIAPYVQEKWSSESNIVSVASSNGKIFVLNDKWYVQYNHGWWWYDKFFINDEMDAWADKTSLIAYRDMILAFWRRHIALWVPDEQNRFWTMYNQSATIWTWSRYSYWEYNWALVFVSNDKRFLTLSIESAWRYWLTFGERQEGTDRLDSKLSALTPWDEVFIWTDNNNLRVFVQTKPIPYVWWEYNLSIEADLNTSANNTITHIYKFDTLFKVRTEDHVQFLISWNNEWVYYWEWWIYSRRDSYVKFIQNQCDVPKVRTFLPYKVNISAFMIENENNWLDWHPTLFSLAKLNRLITTLWPGKYSDWTKIRITSYIKWLWIVYEFPVWTWDDSVINKRVDYITRSYNWRDIKIDDWEDLCLGDIIQDSQKQYQPNCSDSKAYRQASSQTTPRCESYQEMLTESHWICINDKLYQFAPTMPLVTNLWENQDYATQIKIELISEDGDIVTFWWWLAELFIAPLFQKWPDWEYQLQPNTDCD